MFGVTAAFWALETVASWIRLGRWKWLYLWLTNRSAIPAFEQSRDEKLRALEVREPTELPLPWEFWTISIVALLYGLARLYTIVEAFLELRDIDATAFATVDWAEYFPHA